jgi:hypothetical protein
MAVMTDHHWTLEHGVAPSTLCIATLLHRLGEEQSNINLRPLITTHLVIPFELETAGDLSRVPEQAVITRITGSDFANLGIGIVNRLREIVFEPGANCTPCLSARRCTAAQVHHVAPMSTPACRVICTAHTTHTTRHHHRPPLRYRPRLTICRVRLPRAQWQRREWQR